MTEPLVEPSGSDPTDVDEAVDGAAGRGIATQDVHDVLRREILHGVLEPGSEISQLELSKQLSVSRTPLREALKLLEREGLVVNSGPHRLIKISPLTMVDLDDLYSLRVMGEALAIWLTVPTLRDHDFEQLERDLEIVSGATDLAEAEEAHRRFHSGLRVGAGPRLSDHLDMLFEHAERYQRAFARRETGLVKVKQDQHRLILEAARARDRQQARELIVDHVASTAFELMTAESHAPFALPNAIRMATELGRP